MTHQGFSPADDHECRELLAEIGDEQIDDLFAHIPEDFQTDAFDLPPALSEMDMLRHLRELAGRNSTDLTNFCGGGFYDHYIPAAVDALASRGEFFTAYTPYQPEASQGTLQALFEWQTAICRLTDMDASNASLYDGGTALFEAVMMSLRSSRRRRILVDQGVNPIYRTMLKSYTQNLDIAYEELPLAAGRLDPEALAQGLAREPAAVLLQYPNFFGCIEDFTEPIAAAHAADAAAIVSTYPLALGLLKTPGAMGADIVTGEGQSLGLPLSFGGPYLGFMAVRDAWVRKMPGRIVGQTEDLEARRGFVLTLQTREQHIRREKATSNICTNQSLCALRAVIYLTLLGPEGLKETSRECADQAAYAYERLTAIEGVEPAFSPPFFNEFALRLPRDASEVISALIDHGIAPGFPVGRYYEGMEHVLLTAFTEKRTKTDIDILAAQLEALL